MKELTQDAVIVNELGLHARAAAKLAKIAQQAQSRVWISRGETRADSASIIDILTLACGKGATVSFTIENRLDADVLTALVELTENGFEE